MVPYNLPNYERWTYHLDTPFRLRCEITDNCKTFYTNIKSLYVIETNANRLARTPGSTLYAFYENDEIGAVAAPMH